MSFIQLDFCASSWTVKQMQKCIQFQGLKKNELLFPRIREILLDISTQKIGISPLQQGIPFKGKFLSDFLKNLRSFFVLGYAMENSFYLFRIFEDVCRKGNIPLARQLIDVGIPITFSAIKVAFELGRDEVISPLISKVVENAKNDPMTANETAKWIFSSRNQALIIKLIDKLSLTMTYQGQTLTHLATKNGFTDLAKKLVSEKASSLSLLENGPLMDLGEACNEVEDWLQVFKIIYSEADLERLDNSFFFHLVERLDNVLRDPKKLDKKVQEEHFLIAIFKEIISKVSPAKKEELLKYRDHHSHRTLFEKAVLSSLESLALYLLENGVNPMMLNPEFGNIFHLSLPLKLDGLTRVSLTLSERIFDSLDPSEGIALKTMILEERNSDGLTPLLMALNVGNETAFNALLKLGASQQVQDKENWGCVHHALLGGLVSLLKEKNWSFTVEELNCVVNEEKSDIGIECALRGKWESVTWFLENRGNYRQINTEGQTVFNIAVRAGKTEILEKILTLFPKYLQEMSPNEINPLLEALQNNRLDIVTWLLERGVSVENFRTVFLQDEFLNQVDVKAWEAILTYLPKEEQDELKSQSAFIERSLDRYELITFFLKNGFAITPRKFNLLFESIENKVIPVGIKVDLLEELFKRIEPHTKLFNEKTNVGSLFDQGKGDVFIEIYFGEILMPLILDKNVLDFRCSSVIPPRVVFPSNRFPSLESAKSAVRKIFRFFYSNELEVSIDEFKGMAWFAVTFGHEKIKNILEEWLKEHPGLISWKKYLLSSPETSKRRIVDITKRKKLKSEK